MIHAIIASAVNTPITRNTGRDALGFALLSVFALGSGASKAASVFSAVEAFSNSSISSGFFIDDFASIPCDESISRSLALVCLLSEMSFPWLQRLRVNLSK